MSMVMLTSSGPMTVACSNPQANPQTVSDCREPMPSLSSPSHKGRKAVHPGEDFRTLSSRDGCKYSGSLVRLALARLTSRVLPNSSSPFWNSRMPSWVLYCVVPIGATPARDDLPERRASLRREREPPKKRGRATWECWSRPDHDALKGQEVSISSSRPRLSAYSPCGRT